ncbi:MAG: hypothetical protein R3A52_26705 [Polyangiales bacterium]
MLLFHGTRGGRDLLDAIARDGLRAHRHEWTHDRLGHAASTFLSNAPVAGTGGDPVAFARGFTRARSRERDGWIVVVDLPRARWSVIHAVVPNLALEQYFDARALRPQLLSPAPLLATNGATLSRRHGPLVIELLAELGRRDDLAAISRAMRPVRVSQYSDLRADDFSFTNWRRYAGALLDASTLDEVVRAGRRYGFTWDAPEVPHCALCVQGMATWVYALDTPLACAPDDAVALYASVNGRDLFGDGLAPLARAVARGYAGASPADVPEGFARLHREVTGRVAWEHLVAMTPLDVNALPPSWSPDFGRSWTESDLRATDAQVVCDAIAPEHVVGALRVFAGGRLSAWARPRKGETLAARLWHAATVVRERFRGRMVVYEG